MEKACDECAGTGVVDICDEECDDPDCDHEEDCGYCAGTGVAIEDSEEDDKS